MASLILDRIGTCVILGLQIARQIGMPVVWAAWARGEEQLTISVIAHGSGRSSKVYNRLPWVPLERRLDERGVQEDGKDRYLSKH